jgi:hypothetical protein
MGTKYLFDEALLLIQATCIKLRLKATFVSRINIYSTLLTLNILTNQGYNDPVLAVPFVITQFEDISGSRYPGVCYLRF